MPQPPPPIPPRGPSPQSPLAGFRGFFAGAALGTIASGFVHLWVWRDPNNLNEAASIVIVCLVLAKVIGSIVAFFLPGRKPFGIGLLVSLPIGFMIFFGLCAANMKNLNI